MARGGVHRRWRRIAAILVGVVAVAGGMASTALADVEVSDASVVEGDSGTVEMTFTITHDGFYTYETSPGTAQAPADYQAVSGGNCDTSGGTEEITVLVNGDTLNEPDETFTLDATDCSEKFDQGLGTIIDDDDSSSGGPGPGPGPQHPPDSDGDGVVDSQDRCPTVFARTADGCPAPTTQPAPDSDGDGVPNDTDACPLVAGPGPTGCPDVGGTLPPPTFGKTVNLTVLEDDVFIRPPAGAAGAADARAAQKGQGFEALIEPRQVPVGTFVDTTNGKVQLASARNAAGGTQFARVADGLFQVLQSRRTGGATEFRLKGSSFRRCVLPVGGAQASAARRRLSGRTVRRLVSTARGRFRTRGRHSAATVRGTTWITADRCDGTLTRVVRGRVSVRDFRRRRNVTVRFGKPYIARPAGFAQPPR